MSDVVLPQHVVVYQDKSGALVAYDSVYGDDKDVIWDAIWRCEERHGISCEAKVLQEIERKM